MFGGLSYSFVPDRYCSPNLAIYFNKSFLQVPAGVYFAGDFTDNVALSMYGATLQLYEFTFKGSSLSEFVTSPIINLNEWYFVAFVLSGSTDYIYVNGNQVTTGNLHITK